ncbi:hypothetical protein CsSME_00044727 [Camellia sinensis var. sinensis]
MIGMQFNLQDNGLLEVPGFDSSETKWKKGISCASNEPISVLDTRRSPSPSTSTSTLSSSLGGGATAVCGGSGDNTASLAAVSDTIHHLKWPESGPVGLTEPAGEWASELQPIPAALEVSGGERFGIGLEDWESLLSESGQDQSILRWIATEFDDGNVALAAVVNQGSTAVDGGSNVGSGSSSSTPKISSETGNPRASNLGFNNNNTQIPILGSSINNLFSSDLIYQLENPESKPQIFNPQVFINRHQQLSQLSQTQIQTQPYQHHLQQSPLMAIYDQLYKAAELIQSGNFSLAQEILARLNHQLSSPLSKPFQRSAFYFMEALQLSLLMLNHVNPLPPRTPTPFDALFKMGAYKLLSEASPVTHFMNFTSNQAILEALGYGGRVHIIDFDIGFGAQWASLMQELPSRNRCKTPFLKITAFASPLTHHPLELSLMHENLTQFANEIGVNFELEVVNFDAFDPNSYSIPPVRSPDEAIAVSFPIWACSNRLPVLPSLLRFIKQLSPKIMVSMDRGCERTDLPFSQHLFHALQYYEVLFDSIDAANLASETMNKIESFLFQPRIESIVLGRLRAPDHMPHWKQLFASAGFSPVALSNFTETQAECVLKRSQVGGFHVEKRQGSLVLYWQLRELMVASAWRC